MKKLAKHDPLSKQWPSHSFCCFNFDTEAALQSLDFSSRCPSAVTGLPLDSPLRPQPCGNSVPTGAGSVAATKGSFD